LCQSYAKPGPDIPRSYNLVEVAKFSRYYLMEYPVYSWEYGDGLLVVGYPKKSHWKYQFNYPSDWVRSLPQRLVLLLIINVAFALLISIVMDMLEYEMQPLQLQPIRLSVLVRQVVADFLNNGLDDRYDMEWRLSNEEIKIYGDEKLLLRAINNLVQNSIRHNPQGCKIILETSLSEDGSKYRLIIKDSGRGISEEQLKDITELPYSATGNRAVRDREGHGLGIPMVARIMKAHRGRLVLASGADQRGLKAVMEFSMQDDSDCVL